MISAPICCAIFLFVLSQLEKDGYATEENVLIHLNFLEFEIRVSETSQASKN
jgi:hypothetical protein